jgi:hypothetical protein
MTLSSTGLSHARRLFQLSVAAAAVVVLLPTAAVADDDEADSKRIATRVTARGEVIAEMKVAAKPDAVRQQLSGAEKAHGLAPTTVSAKATPDGKCEKVALQTRGLISPFVLETRRCPTKSGWRETLVASDNFIEYWNEWSVKEIAGGTLVTFKTRTLPNVVGIPESIILSQTRRVLGKLMRNLLGALGES